MSDNDVVLLRGRPDSRTIYWSIAVAAVVALLAAGFGTMISVDRSPYVGLGIGAILGGLLLMGVARGSEIALSDHGITYTHGGKANLTVPFSALEEIKPIHDGLLRGAGLIVDRGAVEFHHRSGITIRDMERMTEKIGVDMVLEHLDEEQVAQVEAAWKAWQSAKD